MEALPSMKGLEALITALEKVKLAAGSSLEMTSHLADAISPHNQPYWYLVRTDKVEDWDSAWVPKKVYLDDSMYNAPRNKSLWDVLFFDLDPKERVYVDRGKGIRRHLFFGYCHRARVWASEDIAAWPY